MGRVENTVRADSVVDIDMGLVENRADTWDSQVPGTWNMPNSQFPL